MLCDMNKTKVKIVLVLLLVMNLFSLDIPVLYNFIQTVGYLYRKMEIPKS